VALPLFGLACCQVHSCLVMSFVKPFHVWPQCIHYLSLEFYISSDGTLGAFMPCPSSCSAGPVVASVLGSSIYSCICSLIHLHRMVEDISSLPVFVSGCSWGSISRMCVTGVEKCPATQSLGSWRSCSLAFWSWEFLVIYMMEHRMDTTNAYWGYSCG
jgi:hypothetical protein